MQRFVVGLTHAGSLTDRTLGKGLERTVHYVALFSSTAGLCGRKWGSEYNQRAWGPHLTVHLGLHLSGEGRRRHVNAGCRFCSTELAQWSTGNVPASGESDRNETLADHEGKPLLCGTHRHRGYIQKMYSFFKISFNMTGNMNMSLKTNQNVAFNLDSTR